MNVADLLQPSTPMLPVYEHDQQHPDGSVVRLFTMYVQHFGPKLLGYAFYLWVN